MEQVGIHDNFFELGGDSILSTQIAARAYQAGLYLTPMELFQHQTIAELAIHSKPVSAIQAESDAQVQLAAASSSTDFPEARLSPEKLNELLTTLDELTE
jgi:hypothetical protein